MSRVKDTKCPAPVPCRTGMTRLVESAEKKQESKTQVAVSFEREELYSASRKKKEARETPVLKRKSFGGIPSKGTLFSKIK